MSLYQYVVQKLQIKFEYPKEVNVTPRGVQEQAQGFQETKRRFLQTG